MFLRLRIKDGHHRHQHLIEDEEVLQEKLRAVVDEALFECLLGMAADRAMVTRESVTCTHTRKLDKLRTELSPHHTCTSHPQNRNLTSQTLHSVHTTRQQPHVQNDNCNKPTHFGDEEKNGL